MLNLKGCTFKAVNDSEVYVSGSKHEETPYSLKLEGARRVGFRCLTIAGTRDPIMIAGIDKIIDEVKTSVSRNLSLDDDSIHINFHLYGKNGVMGDHEPMQTAGHELGIVLDVVAPTRRLPTAFARWCALLCCTTAMKTASLPQATWRSRSPLLISRAGQYTNFPYIT